MVIFPRSQWIVSRSGPYRPDGPLEGRRGHPVSGWDMRVSITGESPIAGWFIRENPTKVDDFGVPPFQETSRSRMVESP